MDPLYRHVGGRRRVSTDPLSSPGCELGPVSVVRPIDVYIERGKKRTFACAVDWPGWSRSARDEAAALEALLASAPRFARAMRGTRLRFAAPKGVSAFRVIERLEGDATTDFGAPGATPSADEAAMDDAALARSRAILRACWRAFEDAAHRANGKSLAKGPRGGGRDLAEILGHLVEADLAYVAGIGWKHDPRTAARHDRLAATREALLDGLAASARGEIPARGPRGGVRWKPRKLVRRSAWHWLDHAWETLDRLPA